MSHTDNIMELFSYCRPMGSRTEEKFVEKFLLPLGFERDPFDNLVLQIGDKPRVLFSSHMDTVHKVEGMQDLALEKGFLTQISGNNCLGADDTAGIWLMMEMVKADIPGLYVIHYGEEQGCVGSRDLADHNPDFLDGIEIAIAFDRAYYSDIITHQMGARTASDAFAWSLAKELGGSFQPCNEGAYTDTNEYAHLIPECTNISVGYSGQHSKSEKQDVEFLIALRTALLNVNWDNLVVARDPSVYEELPRFGWGTGKKARKATLEDWIEAYPDVAADMLRAFGIDENQFLEQIEDYYGTVAA